MRAHYKKELKNIPEVRKKKRIRELSKPKNRNENKTEDWKKKRNKDLSRPKSQHLEKDDFKMKYFELLSKHEKLKVNHTKLKNNYTRIEKKWKNDLRRKDARIRSLKVRVEVLEKTKPKKKTNRTKRIVSRPPDTKQFYRGVVNQRLNPTTSNMDDIQLAIALQESLQENVPNIDQMFQMRQNSFLPFPSINSRNRLPENATYEQLLQLDNNNVVVGLDKEILTTFPISLVKEEKICDEKCTVCFEKYNMRENIRTLPCFHFFHVDCIDTWLEAKKKCPICYTKLDEI